MTTDTKAAPEKLTVTMAPPPAALAAEKKKAGAKRSEAENLLEGHAATIKVDEHLQGEAAIRRQKRDGRVGAGVGFLLTGFVALRTITHHGGFLHAVSEGSAVKTTFAEAYTKLGTIPWFFDLTTRVNQFRIFAVLATIFFVSLTIVPRQFGVLWMKLAGVMGFFMTRVILSVFFYIAVTPYALVLKIFGRDPLRLSKHEGSYWVPRDKQRKHDHFERMF